MFILILRPYKAETTIKYNTLECNMFTPENKTPLSKITKIITGLL